MQPCPSFLSLSLSTYSPDLKFVKFPSQTILSYLSTSKASYIREFIYFEGKKEDRREEVLSLLSGSKENGESESCSVGTQERSGGVGRAHVTSH